MLSANAAFTMRMRAFSARRRRLTFACTCLIVLQSVSSCGMHAHTETVLSSCTCIGTLHVQHEKVSHLTPRTTSIGVMPSLDPHAGRHDGTSLAWLAQPKFLTKGLKNRRERKTHPAIRQHIYNRQKILDTHMFTHALMCCWTRTVYKSMALKRGELQNVKVRELSETTCLLAKMISEHH